MRPFESFYLIKFGQQDADSEEWRASHGVEIVRGLTFIEFCEDEMDEN